MVCSYCLRTGVVALVLLGLMAGQAAAGPPKRGPKPGPKARPVAGPTLGPKAGRKPSPTARPIVAPKPHVGKPLKPIAKPGPNVVLPPRRRVVPLPVARAVAPVYGPRVIVGRPGPGVVVSSAEELPVMPSGEVADEEAYRVAAVDENYTVSVVIDGRPTPVRMLGVEPPRVASADEDLSGTVPEAAVQFLHNLLVDEFVYLVEDPLLAAKDAAGNPIAYLYRAPDNLLINVELVRQGYGITTEAYRFEFQEQFAIYQGKAQADQKGIWAGVAVTER